MKQGPRETVASPPEPKRGSLGNHFLSLRGLSAEQLLFHLGNAEGMLEVSNRELKKVPALRGKTVVNLFFEPSTRTRTSFELAAKRLSADVLSIAVAGSSVTKGETLLDTARALEAMSPDIIVLRHFESGAPHFLARHLNGVSVVNAGDGMNEHPSQALLDLLTLRLHLRQFGRDIGTAEDSHGKSRKKLRVAFVGDCLHSRVVGSNVPAHLALEHEVRLVGPPALVPEYFASKECFGEKISVHHKLEQGIADADVVFCLRMQTERQHGGLIPSIEEYARLYCVTEGRLKKHAPNAVVLHAGPMNRGVEISSEVADGPRSLVQRQVAHGIAVRMALLFWVATAKEDNQEVGVVNAYNN